MGWKILSKKILKNRNKLCSKMKKMNNQMSKKKKVFGNQELLHSQLLNLKNKKIKM